jgi:general stress protein 26
MNELTPEKEAKLTALLALKINARMATASPKTIQPHVVPVWYLWDGESMWISSFRSTRKVKELQKNAKISICVDTTDVDPVVGGVVLEGEAELVTEPRPFMEEMTARVYTRYLGPEGVLGKDPQSWIHDPEALLIKLTPKKAYVW